MWNLLTSIENCISCASQTFRPKTIRLNFFTLHNLQFSSSSPKISLDSQCFPSQAAGWCVLAGSSEECEEFTVFYQIQQKTSLLEKHLFWERDKKSYRDYLYKMWQLEKFTSKTWTKDNYLWGRMLKQNEWVFLTPSSSICRDKIWNSPSWHILPYQTRIYNIYKSTCYTYTQNSRPCRILKTLHASLPSVHTCKTCERGKIQDGQHYHFYLPFPETQEATW